MPPKYTNLSDNKSNGHTVYQKVIKDIKIFHSKAFLNVPKTGGGGWFENNQSGNPGFEPDFFLQFWGSGFGNGKSSCWIMTGNERNYVGSID
jgi:hypothetical protein